MEKQVASDKAIGLGDVVARIRVLVYWEDGAETTEKSIQLSFTESDCCAKGFPYRPGQHVLVAGKDLKKLRDFLNENLPKDE